MLNSHRFPARILSLIALCFLVSSQSSQAYSVLTHEQIVDLLWSDQIRPMLLVRYPNATPQELQAAHAYAYGGSLIQDIGYYPFGNRFFSDLVHYVRSGDFVTNMLEESDSLDEYAFALGAVSHYASDTAGHPLVNLAVAENFPRLKTKYGPSVTYVEDPKAHIRTEFGFDVLQVAKDRFTSTAYHDFIGFEVSRPLLERAFFVTYGLHIDDVFSNLDFSMETFRYSVSRLIPHMTQVAIVIKKKEILQDDPTMTRRRFEYRLRRAQFRREWGKQYKGPGLGTRILAFFISLLPKVGPLATLNVKMPTHTTEALYMKSVLDSADHYHQDLLEVAGHNLKLENKDFDTGQETKAGEYSLTDQTYADLLNKLASQKFAHVPPELRANILGFYHDAQPPAFAAKNPAKWARTQNNLAQLQSMPIQTASIP